MNKTSRARGNARTARGLAGRLAGLDGAAGGRRKYPEIIGLQLPEGLKRRALEFSRIIAAKTGAEVIVSTDPCYGACDLAQDLFSLGAGLLVHVGHAPIGAEPKNAIFLPYETGAEIGGDFALTIAGCLEPGTTAGLASTIQYAALLPDLAGELARHGIETIIGKGSKRVSMPGQVLGCDQSSALAVKEKVGAYVYLGDGDFHPQGIAFATGKPVIAADPVTGEVRRIGTDRDRFLRRRHALIELVKSSKSVGIIVCTKTGQARLPAARKLAALARGKGYLVAILAGREVTPEIAVTFPVEALVSLGCPRIALDDSGRFSKPLVTPQEFEIAIGERRWEDYALDCM